MKRKYQRRSVAFLAVALSFIFILFLTLLDQPGDLFDHRAQIISSTMMLLLTSFMAYYWHNRAKKEAS